MAPFQPGSWNTSKKKKKRTARPPTNPQEKHDPKQTSNHDLEVASSLIGPSLMDSLPEEIMDQIIDNIPIQDLPKIMLLSRKFYRQAIPHLYKSVHYFDISFVSPRNITRAGIPYQYNFASLPNNDQAWDPASSARIVRLAQFVRTITEKQLSSHIKEASITTSLIDMEDEGRQVASDVVAREAERERLDLFSEVTAKLVIANSVTSLDIFYIPGPHARDYMYSIFSIESLRHLCLRDFRGRRCFDGIPDDTRVGTSNIISLSLLDAVPLDNDLQEVLTWPKTLQYYNHQNVTEPNGFFPYSFGEVDGASPQRLLQGLASQRGSLQELSYDNEADKCGDDGTTFDTELLSQFTKLTHMNVARECLITYDYSPSGLRFPCGLPPNLLELKLVENIHIPWEPTDGFPITSNIKRIGGWLQEIANHRNNSLPPLAVIINWEAECDGAWERYRAEAQTALELFKGTDARMEVFFKGFETR